MDLENLKSIWKDVSEQETQTSQVSSSQILSLLKGKTQSALSKIRRSVLFEVGSLLVATVIFLLLIIKHHLPSQTLLIVGLVVLVVLSGLYLYKKYSELKKIENQGLPLTESLRLLTSTLDKYLRVYFLGNMLITPIAVAVGFFYGYSLHATSDAWLDEINWLVWLIACFTICLLTVLMYPFMKWYIHKLYGSYLEELKSYLSELEEDFENGSSTDIFPNKS